MPRRALGRFFVLAGSLHFVIPRTYEAIMPAWLPRHRQLVYASGAAEIAGGLAVMVPATRRAGGLLLIATLVGVFPANINMALHAERYSLPRWALLARLPLQGALIAWAERATRAD